MPSGLQGLRWGPHRGPALLRCLLVNLLFFVLLLDRRQSGGGASAGAKNAPAGGGGIFRTAAAVKPLYLIGAKSFKFLNPDCHGVNTNVSIFYAGPVGNRGYLLY